MDDVLGETLSRFVDGDDVEPELLASALDAPDGRRLLMEFGLLRHAIRHDRSAPGRSFYNRLGAMRVEKAGAVERRLPLSWAIAALMLMSALIGFGADVWRHSRADAPPRVERALRFEPSEWRIAKGGAQ
jgi:hypothetical protein